MLLKNMLPSKAVRYLERYSLIIRALEVLLQSICDSHEGLKFTISLRTKVQNMQVLAAC